MTNQPFPQDEHKFDTLSLLAGLTDEDIKGYSLEDILNEFGGRTEEAPPAIPDETPQTVWQPPVTKPEPVKAVQPPVTKPEPIKAVQPPVMKPEPVKEAQPSATKPARTPAKKTPFIDAAVLDEMELPDFLMENLEEVGAAPKPEPEEPVDSEPAAEIPVAAEAQDAEAEPDVLPILQELKEEAENQPADTASLLKEMEEEPAAEDPSFIDQIQHAIDRDLELNQATPEPVIHVDEDGDPTLDDPALDAIFKEKKGRNVEPLPVDPSAAERKIPAEQPKIRQEAPELKVVASPEPVPSAAELYKSSARSVRPSRMRMTAVLLLTLIAVIITAINQFGWSDAAAFARNQIASKILLAVMILCALLSVDVIKAGVKSFMSLRVSAEGMMTLILLVTAIDAILCTDDRPIPFCAVVCVQFYFAVWGHMLRKVSLRRALKPLLKQERKLRGVSVVEQAWDGGNLAASVEDGSEEEHVRGLLKTDLAENRMRIYAPVAVILTLVLAFLVRFKTGNSLTWSWSSMMIGALPLASFISFHRPFAILSARLMKQGAAVSGWAGAEQLSRVQGITLMDADIFPMGSVKINGMKVYGSYSVGQSVGYATAVIEASGSGLISLFQELRTSNNGPFFTVSQFRRYEGGGYGAEIGGDVVLVGSLRFMQLMGVYMHEGTKVKNAIYLSVNGEMCAVFSLSYGASSRVRKGLRQIVGAAGITPVFATRDILITPLMVEDRYKISNAGMEYPGAEERSRLSRLPGDYPAAQTAVLAKSGLGAFADAVIGGRLLRMVTAVSSLINLIGGFVGIALMFLLTWLGAISAVTAMNMLLFALVWTLPTIILTSWLGRY